MTFDGRRPLMEDDLRWKTTFDMVTVYYLKKIFTNPHLDSQAQLTPDRKFYRLPRPEIEFHVMEEMYSTLCMCMFAEKTTFLGKDN